MAVSLIFPAGPVKALERLGRPGNYYQGTRPLSFDPPANVVMWLQKGFQGGASDSFHYRYILTVNLKAPGKTVVDHCIHDFLPGQAMLIFPFQFHHFMVPENAEMKWVFMGFETARSSFFDHLRDTPVPLSPVALETLSRLLTAYSSEISDKKHQNRSPLLLALLLNEIALSRPLRAKDRPIKPKIEETLCARVQRHIYAHITEGLKISAIAKAMGLSEGRLRARYRVEMGLSLGAALRSIRFGRAQELLSVSEMNVSEIAERCGYQSVFAFSSAFKKRYGLPPRDFRKQLC